MMTASTGGCLLNNYLAFYLVLSLDGSIEPRVSIGNNSARSFCLLVSILVSASSHPSSSRSLHTQRLPPSVPCSPQSCLPCWFSPSPPDCRYLSLGPPRGSPSHTRSYTNQKYQQICTFTRHTPYYHTLYCRFVIVQYFYILRSRCCRIKRHSQPIKHGFQSKQTC